MKISSNFDAGSIEIVSADNYEDIQLRIRRDNAAEFAQWFCFRVQGAAYQHCTFNFLNASESAYPDGWIDYQAVASYDRINWFRVPTHYENGVMTMITCRCPAASTTPISSLFLRPAPEFDRPGARLRLCQVSDLALPCSSATSIC